MTIFAFVGVGVFTAKKNGFTFLYTEISEFGIGYFILSIIVAILIHDTFFYWGHRLMHHKSIFRYVHKVHHNSTNPSPWAAFSFHPYESVIEALIVTTHWLWKWNNTSTHHNMHHRFFNCNYGLYFNFWDRVMGTNHPNYHKVFEEVKSRKPIMEA